MSSFELKNLFQIRVSWLVRKKQNTFTSQPCLHTLIWVRVFRDCRYKIFWVLNERIEFLKIEERDCIGTVINFCLGLWKSSILKIEQIHMYWPETILNHDLQPWCDRILAAKHVLFASCLNVNFCDGSSKLRMMKTMVLCC